MHGINKHPDKKELLNFGFMTGGLILVLFGLLLPWFLNYDFPGWPWIIGSILIVWALVVPVSLKPVYRVWMTIGFCLGWINTRIILIMMFYFIILPVGVVMRLTGKDPMSRSMNGKQESYRVISVVPDKKHVERPY